MQTLANIFKSTRLWNNESPKVLYLGSRMREQRPNLEQESISWIRMRIRKRHTQIV
jgi:hypothetical protein